MPATPADAPEVMVDWDWMEAEMRASDNVSSSGPSGYGSNYISVLASDPHCVQALAYLIQQIVNNPLGLSVNAAKCELTSFHIGHANDPADCLSLEQFRASQLRIN